jgi:hypothetical protein
MSATQKSREPAAATRGSLEISGLQVFFDPFYRVSQSIFGGNAGLIELQLHVVQYVLRLTAADTTVFLTAADEY